MLPKFLQDIHITTKRRGIIRFESMKNMSKYLTDKPQICSTHLNSEAVHNTPIPTSPKLSIQDQTWRSSQYHSDWISDPRQLSVFHNGHIDKYACPNMLFVKMRTYHFVWNSCEPWVLRYQNWLRIAGIGFLGMLPSIICVLMVICNRCARVEFKKKCLVTSLCTIAYKYYGKYSVKFGYVST